MTVLEYFGPGTEDWIYSSDMAVAGVAGVFMIIYALMMLFSLALSTATYVLHSLGLYTIAQRRGIHHPWLAWIPIGNLWLLGSVSDQYQYLVKGKVKTRRRMMLGLSIAAVVFYVVMFCSMIVGVVMSGYVTMSEAAGSVLLMFICAFAFLAAAIALTVYEYMCYYDLFSSCEKTNGVLYLILSILFPVVMPFLVFACRKKDDGMPPRKQPAPQSAPVAEIVEEPAPETEEAEPAEEAVPETEETEPVEEGFAQPEEFEEA